MTTKYISVEGLGVIAKKVTGGADPRHLLAAHGPPRQHPGDHRDARGAESSTAAPTGPTARRSDTSGTHTESRGWIDQRNDPETGLTYLHARYFDPKLGIFLSPDPIGVEGGMNEYGYALGNPVNGTDRSGLLLDAGCWLWEQVIDYLTEQKSYRCVASSGGAGGTSSGGSSTDSNGDGGRGVCTGTCTDKEKPKEEVPPVVTPPNTTPPPKKSNPISNLFKSGACAAARLFFAPIAFPDVLPGSGDLGVSLSVSVSSSVSVGTQGASLTRVWMPGGDYATYVSNSAGLTVGAEDVAATAVGSVQIGVVRQPNFGEFAGGGWQGSASAAAGPGAAADLTISDGNAWGLSFGLAAGLTAGVAGEKTETLLLETGNVLRDMGCH